MSTTEHPDYLAETYSKARAQLDGSLPAALDGFMTRWFDAVNAQDIDAQLEMCTDDVYVEDPAMQGRFTRGKDEFRRFAEITYNAFPDMQFAEIGAPYLALDGDSLAVRWRGTATLTGDIVGWPPENPAPRVDATGRKFDLEGYDIYQFSGGRISTWLIRYDNLEMATQLGLLPAA
ncbi:ester cyclase [Myceligenerans pegani]|uniref:Ester cyclase n=1 Tax=Myceligenerans pegani TaxID=2776917 RepID=A0ABR9MVG7_9MICO|nr:ester cyclase [Myceligenerans sp. TRM 65318]MBE1875382.1 ester cyclase [Myceligenerans sp. TRM 65318]MBE3017653.1 ester cyclase [Myceligenerans sp. TRM 65318]